MERDKLPYTILKAFTTSPEGGNPASIVILPPPSFSSTGESMDVDKVDIKSFYPPDEILHSIAIKFNLPMTAFAIRLNSNADPTYALRWFYPAGEAELCGHATLALSSYLFNTLSPSPTTIHYRTVKYGIISVNKSPDPWNSGSSDAKEQKNVEPYVAMDFPELTVGKELSPDSERYDAVLNRVLESSSSSNLHKENVQGIWEEEGRILLYIKQGVELKNIDIDPKKLEPRDKEPVFQGRYCLLYQVVPASEDAQSPHIYTRCIGTHPDFAEEDVATGSAHCLIIPHILTHPASLEALRQDHPKYTFATEDPTSYNIRVKQVSKQGGNMIVKWLKDEHKCRIMGKAIDIEKGLMDLKTGHRETS